MTKLVRRVQRPVEDVLRGSAADIDAGRVQDFDAFLAEMHAAVRQRVAEIESEAILQPALRSKS